jgi:two-component system, OmpR family, phosphate regulon sensor histidine kinase PhoR
VKIRTKLTILFIALSLGIIAAAGTFTTLTVEKYFHNRILNELKTQANEIEYMLSVSHGKETNRYDRLQELAHIANLRLTLIDKKGIVLFESNLESAQMQLMENHLSRPEIQGAMQNGTGTDTRHSATLNIDMLYYAKKITYPFPEDNPFHDAFIFRVGIPLTQINVAMDEIQTNVIIASIIVLIIVVSLSFILSRKLAAPLQEMDLIAAEIRRGNLDMRMPIYSNDEIGKLGETLNSMIEKLNEDIVKLKKLERVRTEFLGNVSHELRTPIFAVQGMLETLEQGAIDDKEVSKEFIERALANTKRLNSLLSDLIEISRIETGDMKMSFRYFALDEFLHSIISDMTPAAEQKKITLHYERQERKIDVYGDRERLKQVMINLIDNALKYTPSGGSVAITYQADDSTAIISVKDTGVGISSEHLPRIFERFYRVDRERSRDAGGTGLGLAIVKHIVEAHGSKVEVQSDAGKGSTFSFALKL